MQILRVILVFLFLGGPLLAKQIEIIQPERALCYGEKYTLQYSISKEIAKNEEFILYFDFGTGEATRVLDAAQSSVTDSYYFSAKVYIKGQSSGLSSDTITFEVLPYHGIFLKYDITPICSGSTPISLYGTLQTSDKISWFKGDSLLTNQTKDTLTIFESGTYTSKIARGYCNTLVSGGANISIGKIPAANLYSYSSPAVCKGYIVPINSWFSNKADLKYQWLLDGQSIPNAQKNTYDADKTGHYQLLVKQDTCTSISEALAIQVGTLSLNPILAEGFDEHRGEITICKSFGINLIANGRSLRPHIAISWLKDGIAIPNSETEQIKITEPGSYRYLVKDGECQALSAPLLIKHGNLQAINVNTPLSTSFCKGRSVQLFTGPAPSFNKFSKSFFNFTLWKDHKKLDNFSNSFPAISIKEPGEYYFTANLGDSSCVVYSDTLNIKGFDKEIPFEIYDTYPGVQKIQVCGDSTILGNSYFFGVSPILYKLGAKAKWYLGDKLEKEIKITYYSSSSYAAKKEGIYRLTVETDSACTYVSSPLKVVFNKARIKIQTTTEAPCADALNELYLQIRSNDELILDLDGRDFDEFVNKFGKFYPPQWYYEGQLLGSRLRQLVSRPGAYHAKYETPACTIYSDTIRIHPEQISPELIPNIPETGICPNGGYVTLRPKEIGEKYLWITDSLNQTATTTTIKAYKSGTYRVWFEKKGCGKMSNPITVKQEIALPTATITKAEQAFGDSVGLLLHFTGSAPWNYTLSDGQSKTADQSPIFFQIKPVNTTTYSISSVENPCGTGHTFGEVQVKILPLANILDQAVFNYFPNPSSGRLKVSFNDAKAFVASFQIFDLNGRVMQSGTLDSLRPEIDLNRLISGTYILDLVRNGEHFRRKLILTR